MSRIDEGHAIPLPDAERRWGGHGPRTAAREHQRVPQQRQGQAGNVQLYRDVVQRVAQDPRVDVDFHTAVADGEDLLNLLRLSRLS